MGNTSTAMNFEPMPTPLHQRGHGESAQAYQAYGMYRDLGPTRTLAGAWHTHRQTSRKPGKSRGRPRLPHAEARHPAGQWTTWSSRWQWAERAADYDAHVDAEKRRAGLERIQELEGQRLQVELAGQERLEELVWNLEAQLDRVGSLPITGYTVWKREVDGKNVAASKTQVQSVNLFGYARLLRESNETARAAIVGGARRGRQTGAPDPGTDGAVLDAPGIYSNSSFRGRTAEDSASALGANRLPGESTRAYRAFCAYRDQGSQRSLAAAWMADRHNAHAATRAYRRDQGTPRASAGHWPTWSRQWNWVVRAAAYDARVEATQRQAQLDRSKQIERRRLDFELANQERLETRCEKIRALLAKVVDAPITDITQCTEYTLGKRVSKTKTHVEGRNLASLAALSKQYKETLCQTVVGVRENSRDLGAVLSSFARGLMVTSVALLNRA
jgi:hypothetical protein